MAHNLNYNRKTGKHAFVKVGEKAWHGLGVYVNQAMTAEEAIRLGGLDYIVEKQPLVTEKGVAVPGFYATVRTDTGDALGVVSEQYHVVQNHEVFNFFDPIIDRNEAIYETAGALGKGETIFITAKLPSDILVHGEVVENYVVLSSGHHGRKGGAIQVGFSSIAVVCQNTLRAALKEMQNKITILHFSNAKEKLETAHKIMGMTSTYTQQLNSIFNRMAEVKITDAKLREYIEAVMRPNKEQISKEEYSKRFVNMVDDIFAFAKDHETQQYDTRANTVWGAYNAISGYYGYIKNYKSQEEKFNDMYFKAAADKLEKSFDLAVSLL